MAATFQPSANLMTKPRLLAAFLLVASVIARGEVGREPNCQRNEQGSPDPSRAIRCTSR